MLRRRAGRAELTVPPAAEPLYDVNFLLTVLCQSCFVIAHSLMAHYSRWIDFLGGDLQQIGNVMGLGAALGLALRPWMAQWIGRFGAKAMWGVGYLLFIASSLSNLLLQEVALAIYCVRSGIVLAAAIVFASSLTYVAQTAPESRRTEAIGILGVGGFLGMLVGPLLGDFFLGTVERARTDFTALFVAAALANAVPAVLLFRLRAPRHPPEPTRLRVRDFVATVRRYWPGPILLVNLAFGVCMTIPFVFVANFIDDAPLRIPGLSVIGLYFGCYAGLAIIVRLLLRRLPDRIGPRRVLVTGMWFMGLGMAAFTGVSSEAPWMIIVPALATGVGHSLMFHTMTSLAIEPFPMAVRGAAAALALMMLDLGTFAGAPLLGWIGDRFGFPALFSATAACCCLAAMTYQTATRPRSSR